MLWHCTMAYTIIIIIFDMYIQMFVFMSIIKCSFQSVGRNNRPIESNDILVVVVPSVWCATPQLVSVEHFTFSVSEPRQPYYLSLHSTAQLMACLS